MAPNPGRLVTLYTGTLDTGGVTWGEHHVKTKAGTTVMHLQAYGCQGLPATQQKRGERRGTLSLTAPRRKPPCQRQTCSLQHRERTHFCCVSHPL